MNKNPSPFTSNTPFLFPVSNPSLFTSNTPPFFPNFNLFAPATHPYSKSYPHSSYKPPCHPELKLRLIRSNQKTVARRAKWINNHFKHALHPCNSLFYTLDRPPLTCDMYTWLGRANSVSLLWNNSVQLLRVSGLHSIPNGTTSAQWAAWGCSRLLCSMHRRAHEKACSS